MVHYKKKGLPSEGDLVICKVKNVLPHCAFVDLLEYVNKDGMVHISEVASGWVKNIRNYLQENKQVVCKVVGVNKEKGHIDLSLKRVSSGEKKSALLAWKMEKRMEMLFEYISKQMNKELDEVYKTVCDPIVKEYGSLSAFYNDVKEKGVGIMKSLSIPEECAEKMASAIEDQIKTHRVSVRGNLELTSYEGDGMSRIKTVLSDLPLDGAEVKISYLGAPRYRMEVLANNYGSAEAVLSKMLSEIESKAKAMKVEYKWSR